MSVQKTASSFQQLSDEESSILQKCKEIANEVNKLDTELLGKMTPLDAVVSSIEEYALVKEFRASKMVYKLEKVKFLKEKIGKMLKI